MLKINIKYLALFILMVFLIKIGVADPLRGGQRKLESKSSVYSETPSFLMGR